MAHLNSFEHVLARAQCRFALHECAAYQQCLWHEAEYSWQTLVNQGLLECLLHSVIVHLEGGKN